LGNELEAIKNILKRERLARKQAEDVIEKKSLELYNLNQELLNANQELESKILKRTKELQEKSLHIKSNEERINLAIESAGLGVWDWNIEENNLFYSEEIAALGGYSKQEFQKDFESFFDIIHPEDHEKTKKGIVAHLKGKTKRITVDIRLLKKSGGYLWVFIAGKVIQRKQNGIATRITGVYQDISIKKQNEFELISAKEKAEYASKAKADFLSTMSHEIRTPLNGIIGTTNLLLESSPKDDQLKLLEALRFSGKTLMHIINDILDFSKIESGKIKLENSVFDLKELMDSINSTFQLRAEQKGLNLTFSCHQEMPKIVFGDSSKLLIVLNNLIGNAIKFTNKGSVKIYGDFRFPHKGEVEITFKIVDTGIGISKENFDKVFESFSQEGQYINRKFGGTGLGLAITKKLIEIQRGQISLESQVGKGSTFKFSIPFLLPNKKPKQVKNPEESEKELFDLKEAKVLLVEDNPMNQMIAETFLTKWNAKVTIANNGLEALNKLKEETYNVILMDIQMPIMDGYEATKQIRGTLGLKELPIIALTASAMIEVRKKVLAAGMNDMVTKPFEPKALFAAVLKCLYR